MQIKLASSATLLKLFILNLILAIVVASYTTYVAITGQFDFLNLVLVVGSWPLVLISSLLTVSHTKTNLNLYRHLLDDVLWEEKEGNIECG